VCYGSLTAAQSGLYSVTGYAGDITREIGITYVDPTVGVFSAMMITAALLHRRRTGKGQYLDISMLEVMETIMPEALLQYAINGREPDYVGNHDSLMSPHNCYKARGGVEDWVAIACGSEDEWRALCDVIGEPALADDPKFRTAALRKQNEQELDAIITRWTSERDRWEITERLQAAGVSAIPVMGNQDIAEDAHMHERGFLVQPDHPRSGRHIHAGVPWIMSGTPCRIWRHAPILGQDTDYVLGSILGYPAHKISHLRETGIPT
jgi:crotonobetainyl-CoA:carnitine CoA-transferase CaiB-like acyl-CoA transferase